MAFCTRLQSASEGVRKMARQAARQDGHDIVTLRKHSIIALARQPQIAGRSDPILCRSRRCVDGAHLLATHLHFHEYRQIALACNDVDLTKLGARAKGDDSTTLQHEVESSQILGRHGPAKRLTAVGRGSPIAHRRPSCREAVGRVPSWKDPSAATLPRRPWRSAGSWLGRSGSHRHPRLRPGAPVADQ